MDLINEAINHTKKEFGPGNSDKLSTEKEVIARYSKVFITSHINDLQWEEFHGFMLFSNNHHWSSLQRSSGALKANFDKLKIALKILLNEDMPIEERLQRTVSVDGENKVTGLGPALVTAILTVAFPEKYAVYNSTVEKAINLIQDNMYSKNYFARQYENFNEYANNLAKEYSISLWELDWAWYFINSQFKEDKNTIPIVSKIGLPNEEEELNSGKIVMDNEDLEFPRNIILYGPVGTGKTFLATKIARGIINGSILTLQDLREWLRKPLSEEPSKGDQIKVITMHKSYGYEQFVEGLKPRSTGLGMIEYKSEAGTFKRFSDIAKESLLNDKNEKYVLILDEINRADISRVFGELITLLDQDKRELSKESPGMKIELIYSHEQFSVPINLYIIGTMNTTDKSIALMDLAIRRRFHFIEVKPDKEVLDRLLKLEGSSDDVREAIFHIFDVLNSKIAEFRGPDYGIGQAYFKDIGSEEDLMNSWDYKIMPLLQEYFYGENERLLEILRSVIVTREVDGNNAVKIQQYHSFESPEKFLKSVLESARKTANNPT